MNRRKVLTSKTHCEFCGFEFSESVKCSECGGLNLKNSDVCRMSSSIRFGQDGGNRAGFSQ